MTLAAVNVRQYSSFDLYKQGISNTRRSRNIKPAGSAVRADSGSPKTSRLPLLGFSPRSILVSILVVVSFLAVTLPATKAFGGLSLVSTERQTADSKGNSISITVKEGDTLWSVANRINPKKDPRIIVDQLVKARGTSNLYVGESIEWTK